MSTRDEEVFDAFIRIWAAWWSSVPPLLARQEPSVVARLLNLGLREEGISQSDLRRELGMNQPRLSKLMKKLLRAGWIRVKRSKTDNRVKLMTTTVSAGDWLTSVKADLATLLRTQGSSAPVQRPKPAAPRRRKGISEQPGQTHFFER